MLPYFIVENIKMHTGDGWFRDTNKSFSKISEEETLTERTKAQNGKNLYSLNLRPKRMGKEGQIRREGGVKDIISSFF